MINKPRHNRRSTQSGNIFFMLFASVALVGAFGVGASNVMKGLVASMSDVTRKTIAEEKMTAGARLAVQNATTTQGTGGNCDADPLVEPLPFRAAGTANHPVGGGYLPLEIGASLTDPWGTPYGYCAWDPGTVRDDPGCGGPGANRRIGMGSDVEASAGLVVAVISAGKDRRFTTTCNDFVDVAPADGAPDTPLIGRGTGGDDIVFEYTYNEANGLSGDDLWRVKDTAPDTAQIDKNVEIGGDASMDGVLELRNRGLLLPDETETGPCTALNEAELRVNTSSSPSVLEICYDTQWVPISMGSNGGGGAPGECGVNWALVPGGLTGSGAGEDIAYGNGIYVAVGGGGIQTSPDGVVWTARTKAAGAMDPRGITFGNGRFVATAHNNGTWSTMTSTDGITWTAGNSTQSGINNVAYGANMFVAVGWDGFIISSPDGTNWTQRSATGDEWRDVIFANGQFLAIGAPPSGNVATSNDGITWTIQAGSGTPYTKLAYGESLYVGTANSNMAYSSNGITWNGTSVGSGDWNRVIYTTTGRFVAIHYDSGEIAFSDDGVAWTIESGLLDNTKLWSGLIEGDGNLIATALDGTIYSSFCDSQPTDTEEARIVLPDPVAHLKLDDQTGTNVADTMNRVTATLTGASSPPTVMGQIGRAFDLDGTNDRISIAANSAINALTQYTISFWIYGVNSGSFQYLIDNRNVGYAGLRFVRNDVTHYLTLTIGNGNFTTDQTVPNGVWSHVALTYNTMNLTQPPVIYINGVAATYSSSTLPSAYALSGANWSIGSTLSGASGWNPGSFDDVRIYGQVLSPEQITLLYNDRTSTAYVAPNPVAIVAAGKYRGKITAFENQACGIKEDGSAWCWGDEANGSLGNGAAGPSVSPSRVETQTGPNNFTQVSMGLNFACGIKGDRTAWCWGTDADGQLGNGAATTGTQHNPVVVNGGSVWTQISAGGSHACGIQTDGNIYCWGDGGSGQLGTAAGPNTQPVVITQPGPWVSVAAGGYSTCGIKADGSAWCWGDQNNGRLGNGLTASVAVNTPTPVLEPGPWVKLSRSGDHTCGIKLDGSAWCWGAAIYGKLGNGTTTPNIGKAQRVVDSGPWIDIETAPIDHHSCGIKYDGTLWCWGNDSSDQLGNGASSTSRSSPARVLDSGPWAAVTLGVNMTCGLKADGSAWCWGSDTNGRLGNGSAITGTQNVPTRVENFPNVTPFALNDAQTVMTKNTAATTISLGSNVGQIGFDGNSGGFGYSSTGTALLRNPAGHSGLSIESSGAFDSQISLKTVTGATTRSIGVDNVTGNLEFGNNVAAVTNFMSAITPQMVINNTGQVGVGTQTPGVRLGISGGGIRVGNDTRTCTISRRGVLRFNSGTMQYCNGSTWISM